MVDTLDPKCADCGEPQSKPGVIAICDTWHKPITKATLDLVAIRARSDAYFSQLEKWFEPRTVEVDRRDLLDEIDLLRQENRNFRLRAERHREERKILHDEIERLRAIVKSLEPGPQCQSYINLSRSRTCGKHRDHVVHASPAAVGYHDFVEPMI